MTTQIKKYITAALVAVSVCIICALVYIANASREKREQAAAPDRNKEVDALAKKSTEEIDHIKEIFALAKTSAEEDFNVNFCGFFVGMSRYDAMDLASHYKLKEGEYSVWAGPGMAVSRLWFSLKGVRRIIGGGSTLDELAQAVANRVGDLKGDRETMEYTHKTIDGVVVRFGNEGLRIENKGIASKNPIVTKINEQKESLEKEEIIPSIIGNMVSIPGKSFKMGKYEVTQAQWLAVMGCNTSYCESDFSHPVKDVTWNDCKKFLKKLNALPEVTSLGLVFRLPTVAEWEYACRAGATGDYCRLADGREIGESELDKVAWYNRNSDKTTHPVGQKEPNAFGLYDMHGNVEECCEDVEYSSFFGRRQCVYKGGCIYSPDYSCDTGDSSSSSLDYCSKSSGFRLAVSQD